MVMSTRLFIFFTKWNYNLQKYHPLCHKWSHDRLYRRDGFLLYIYFPVKFIFLLLLNFDLFHTAPCPVYLLCPLQTVSPDTEIVGLFLFEVLYYHFVFGDQLTFFVLPLFGGTVTDLIAFC